MAIVESFKDFISRLQTDIAFTVVFVLSIVAFAFFYFYIIRFLFNKNASAIVYVFTTCMVVLGFVVLFSKNLQNSLFLLVPLILIILVCVLFPTEIKRLVWARRKLADLKSSGDENDVNDESVQNCIEEMITALQNMSKNNVGAIVVLSNGNVPAQVIESGVRLESDVSSELIESVFFPKTPLHDGAMIVDGTRIVAAGCFLPLTQNMDNVPKDLGTRHRAGLGITETIDVVSIIVSEETGIISVAKAGKLIRYADYETLKDTLRKYYWQ